MAGYRGIDVSVYQGEIDWRQVKAAGVQFAILRAAYGTAEDAAFQRNYRGARAAGLPVGAYLYSLAETAGAALREADALARILHGMQLAFPVYLDVENEAQRRLSKARCTALVRAFCERLERERYWAGVYSYDAFFGSNLYPEIQKRYAVWCARVSEKPRICKTYQIHQYSFSGRVTGISGEVDLDLCSYWYPPAVKRAGLNGYDNRA